MIKKILAIALVICAAVITTSGQAANLNQAASNLSDNEEWSIMAHAAIGHHTGSNYLRSALTNAAATDYEKRILAITAQGQNPRAWGNENFVNSLLAKFDGQQIGDPNLINDDIFGLLALKSAGESGDIVNKLRDHIQANQNPDGGWSFSRGGASDSNTTAMAIAALKSAGSTAGGGATYIMSTQDSNGGFGFTPNQAADGASTAWSIIGLRANGSTVPQNAITFLESLQTPNGGFKWKITDSGASDLVTAYAIIALSGKTLPINTISNNQAPQPNPTVAGTTTSNPTPQPPTLNPRVVNNAACINLTAPDQVAVNQSFFSKITVTNTGSSTWTSDTTPHRLGSQNPQDAHTWGNSRINLPASTITPGQSVTFTFNAKAPATAGVTPFAWQPLEEDVEWFGKICHKNITVNNNPTPEPTVSPVAPQLPTTNTQTPTIQATDTNNSDYSVSISYPGNKIYIGTASFSDTNLTAGGQNYSYSNPRAIGTLIAAAGEINLLYEIKNTALGPFVYAINGYAPNGANGWIYAVNGQIPSVGAADYVLKPGDYVQWFFGGANTQPY